MPLSPNPPTQEHSSKNEANSSSSSSSQTNFVDSTTDIAVSTNDSSTNYFKVLPRGDHLQVGDLELHLMTAVHYKDFPARDGFHVFLNGWVRHKSVMDFKCCLLNSLNVNESQVLEVKAYTYHVYSQWVVDMQNGEYSCSLSKNQLALHKIASPLEYKYVTFVRSSCVDAPRSVGK